MRSERYLKITLKTSVSVHLPRGRTVDRAITREGLRAALCSAGDQWDDGRRDFLVEQLQAAAGTIVRSSIERIVDEYLRDNDFKMPLQADLEGIREKVGDHVALMMARVFVRHTSVSDDHELEFKIEEEGEIQ